MVNSWLDDLDKSPFKDGAHVARAKGDPDKGEKAHGGTPNTGNCLIPDNGKNCMAEAYSPDPEGDPHGRMPIPEPAECTRDEKKP